MTNQKSTAAARLKQDYIRLKRDPVPYITAEPLPQNILEWHYVIKGPEDSPYYGGFYHGALMFTKEFPFKPPSIYIFTPNGRFKTNKRLCLSISDFHPDTWNPAWSIATILTGLLSFMLENTPTLGSCESTTKEKRRFAEQSLEFNLRNDVFVELFPDVVAEIKERLGRIAEAQNIANNNKDAAGRPLENGNGMANGVGVMGEGAAGTASGDGNLNSVWQGLGANLVFFILFIIFALIVHYVLKTMNVE